VNPAVPGLFTVTANGTTSVAAINQDGSINSAANPAAPGSIISLYMTGVGAYEQTIADGSLGTLKPPFAMPILRVSATISNEPASVIFAGQAPALVAGAVQVNLQVPSEAKSGTSYVIVYVGDYSTPTASIFIGTPTN
jgi:uncharacterized protein (TIGR03437 family)